MFKTVRLQPDSSGQVLARFRQNGFTVDYANLTEQEVEMLGKDHDLTGPIELSALHLLMELDEKQKAAAPAAKKSPLHSMLVIFTGRNRGR